MTRHKLADTSAFVTLLAGDDVHTSDYASKYRDTLDLSSGESLLRRSRLVWPHLDQLVKNRKSCILELVTECIAGGVAQVVVLGSGVDQLSLELASRTRNVRMYEVDFDQMDAKQSLVRRIAPDTVGRIFHVTADLACPGEVVRGVESAGWDGSIPSILVFEGISYYLEQKDLWGVMAAFGKNAANDIILEYIVPSTMIDPARSHIPDEVFGIIRKSLADPIAISRLDYDTIRSRVNLMGGRVVSRHTMRSMELKRTGTNLHFSTDRSGWVEICRISIPPGDAA